MELGGTGSGFVAYIAALAAMVLSHAVLSAPGVRPLLVRRLGRPGFIAVYSAVSFGALAALVWTYLTVDSGPWLFEPPTSAPLAAVVIMPLAVFLVVGRITTPYGAPEAPLAPAGIYRVCRYPGSVGLLIWALLHLINFGDARRALLFGVMALISILALVKNDRLRRRADDGHLDDTRIVPFSAIFAARQEMPWREIAWWRFALAAAIYLALLLGHPWLLGADPLALL